MSTSSNVVINHTQFTKVRGMFADLVAKQDVAGIMRLAKARLERERHPVAIAAVHVYAAIAAGRMLGRSPLAMQHLLQAKELIDGLEYASVPMRLRVVLAVNLCKYATCSDSEALIQIEKLERDYDQLVGNAFDATEKEELRAQVTRTVASLRMAAAAA